MGVATSDELVRLGREALTAADWERARSFFEGAAEFGETAEILDGMGEALHSLREREGVASLAPQRAKTSEPEGPLDSAVRL